MRSHTHTHTHEQVPLVPSAGLLLDKVIYRQFCKRFPHVASLEFVDLEDKMDTFKQEMVNQKKT